MLKLETSNLICRLTMKSTNEKYAKLGQTGGKVVTLFLPIFRIFGPLHISGSVGEVTF